jgi:hypothetical protein
MAGVSENERDSSADCKLIFGEGVGDRVFFFNCNIAVLCGIEHLAALLAFDKFDVVLSGNDFNDGMFADVSHFGECEWYGFCPSPESLSILF